MNKTIIIQKTTDDSLTDTLRNLYGSLKGLGRNERVHFDLTLLQWIHPLLILPLASYIQTTDSTFNAVGAEQLKSYLDCVRFPNGVDSVSSFDAFVQSQKNISRSVYCGNPTG